MIDLSTCQDGGNYDGPEEGKSVSAKRDYHNWTGDRRYVRRGNDGRFRESDDIGSSIASDRHLHVETKSGQDDRDDGKKG